MGIPVRAEYRRITRLPEHARAADYPRHPDYGQAIVGYYNGPQHRRDN